jgi:hypothetical protein
MSPLGSKAEIRDLVDWDEQRNVALPRTHINKRPAVSGDNIIKVWSMVNFDHTVGKETEPMRRELNTTKIDSLIEDRLY